MVGECVWRGFLWRVGVKARISRTRRGEPHFRAEDHHGRDLSVRLPLHSEK